MVITNLTLPSERSNEPGGKHLRIASKFLMKAKLIPLRLNESLGVITLTDLIEALRPFVDE